MDRRMCEPNPSDRIMNLAPHPDDEVLAAGGLIAKALNSSSQPNIQGIIATNGDASYTTAFLHGSHLPSKKNFQRRAAARQKESLNALAALGLEAKRKHFLGFTDRGLADLWRGRWDHE